MQFSPHVEDDRTAFECLRLSQLREIAKDNGVDVPTTMTSKMLIPILEGRGIAPRMPSTKSRGMSPDAVEKMRASIEAEINEMKPSELMSIAKQYGVHMSIRMKPEEMEAARKELISKI